MLSLFSLPTSSTEFSTNASTWSAGLVGDLLLAAAIVIGLIITGMVIGAIVSAIKGAVAKALHRRRGGGRRRRR